VSEGAARDITASKMNFLGVAHTIALPLADEKYFPSRDPKSTKLLIMVYWGTTNTGERPGDSDGLNQIAAAKAITITQLPHMSGNAKFDACSGMAPVSTPELQAEDSDAAFGLASAEESVRDQQDWHNARLLGYDSWWNATSDDPALGPAARAQRQIMIGELEDERYFVVLQAYDWEKLYRTKEHKLLWETRYSVRSRGHDFSRDLAAMTREAARYFGHSSDGLVHGVPAGKVWVGEAKPVADVEPAK
jgi:hypothetical protein